MKISVVIPTYNRADDLSKTLKSFDTKKEYLKEILVVDQSKDEKTKNLIKNLKNKKIKYIYSKIPSITIARNLGVEKSSKDTDLICFIDDDVTLGKSYFSEIKKVFDENPSAKAAAGYNGAENTGKTENLLKRIFFLRYIEKKERARIISAYGNTYPFYLKKTIKAQWLPGVNMCYKKDIFKEQKFDDNLLGYTIAEDIDFTYRLWKRHPDSLFITPFAKIKHRASLVERTPNEKMAYINQVDHFYFNYKNLNNTLLQKTIFIWSLIGIILLRTVNLLSFKKVDYLKWKYFFKSFFYCILNLNKIKKGKVREF